MVLLSREEAVVGREYLPSNYNFEVGKTVRQIKRRGSRSVALQFPEGLLRYSTVISDIIRSSTDASVVILSDVVYGACCVDDISGLLVECDLLIHYGHSCLIEIGRCVIPVLYIFVDIKISVDHCVSLIGRHFMGLDEEIGLMGTIQYNGAIHKIKEGVERMKLACGEGSAIKIPKVAPLSRGEVLGCTSPVIPYKTVVFVAEGRFHLESLMIRNPESRFFRYCPSSRVMVEEKHDYRKFLAIRNEKKELAAKAKTFSIIFGTLGRQGSLKILENVRRSLRERRKKFIVVFVSEIDEQLVGRLGTVSDCIVEIACPRLCTDWGQAFEVPMITPFEYFASVRNMEIRKYPMDYYSRETSELWNNNVGAG